MGSSSRARHGVYLVSLPPSPKWPLGMNSTVPCVEEALLGLPGRGGSAHQVRAGVVWGPGDTGEGRATSLPGAHPREWQAALPAIRPG